MNVLVGHCHSWNEEPITLIEFVTRWRSRCLLRQYDNDRFSPGNVNFLP